MGRWPTINSKWSAPEGSGDDDSEEASKIDMKTSSGSPIRQEGIDDRVAYTEESVSG